MLFWRVPSWHNPAFQLLRIAIRRYDPVVSVWWLDSLGRPERKQRGRFDCTQQERDKLCISKARAVTEPSHYDVCGTSSTEVGEAFWRLKDSHVPVWSIVAALLPDRSNKAQVAADYQISAEAVDAAWAYCQRHRAAIDAWLLLNRAA